MDLHLIPKINRDSYFVVARRGHPALVGVFSTEIDYHRGVFQIVFGVNRIAGSADDKKARRHFDTPQGRRAGWWAGVFHSTDDLVAGGRDQPGGAQHVLLPEGVHGGEFLFQTFGRDVLLNKACFFVRPIHCL
jgi:hypothetical protein